MLNDICPVAPVNLMMIVQSPAWPADVVVELACCPVPENDLVNTVAPAASLTVTDADPEDICIAQETDAFDAAFDQVFVSDELEKDTCFAYENEPPVEQAASWPLVDWLASQPAPVHPLNVKLPIINTAKIPSRIFATKDVHALRLRIKISEKGPQCVAAGRPGF